MQKNPGNNDLNDSCPPAMELKMNDLKTKKSSIAHAVGGVLALIALNLQAQEAPDDATTEGSEDGAERVLVTGSQIRRSEFKGEQPVEIIKAEDAAAQGIKNVGELLRSITVASGSPQVTAASGTQFNNNGGEGVETLSMRGLGANRTLVLLNGRRAGPAGTRGGTSSFDFNVLPIAMVDRIEILKDGASSLYGSDAVAGVVNIITKKGDGGEVNVFTSQPQDQGGENNRLSATWGTSTNNGSFRVVADYNKQTELARGQRDYLTCGRRNISDPNTGANIDPIDPRTGKPHCYDLIWGHVWVYDYSAGTGDFELSLAQYDYDGSLAAIPDLQDPLYRYPNSIDPLNPDQLVTPNGWYRARFDRLSDSITNANHPFQDQQSLIPAVERATVYAQGDYEFSNGITTYAELLLNRRKTKTNSYAQIWGYVYNENSNGFATDNPSSAGWAGANFLSPLTITDHFDSSTQVDYLRTVLGAKGEMGDWYWDASYQFSRSDGRYTNDEVYDDAVRGQDWHDGSFSCAGITNAHGAPCVEIPWLDPNFLRGDIPTQVQNYLFTEQTGKTIYEQSSFEFVVTGDVVDLPAGPLGIAIGMSYRTDKINDTPGEIWLNDNSWYGISAGITKGSDTTQAVFAETRVPLLSGLTGVENLELSLSGRFTDVDSAGSANTYKAGLHWTIGSGVSVPASQGTSFRAPALFELYLADETSSIAQRNIDVCANWGAALEAGDITQRIADNCAAEGIPDDKVPGAISATIFTSGGLGELENETSTAKTWGIVWNADDIELSISLDHFEFVVKDEVTILGADDIVRQCYDSLYFPTDPLCDLFDRADGSDGTVADGRIEPVRVHYINIAQQINRGYDFAIDYRTETPIGKLGLQTRFTQQQESSRELFAGTFEDENGQFGDPKDTATINASLEQANWIYNWSVQYYGPVSNVKDNGGVTSTYYGDEVGVQLTADAFVYHSFSLTHMFDDSGFMATFGVANAFDKRPPRVSTRIVDLDYVGDAAFYSQYDFIGRRFFADLTYKF